MLSKEQILAENKQRLKALDVTYNQFTGEGSFIPRTEIVYKAMDKERHLWLPDTMMQIPAIESLYKTKSIEQTIKETIGGTITDTIINDFEVGLINDRYDHDFEFWAIVAVQIKPKSNDGEINKQTSIPFSLNYAQRAIFLVALEDMRLNGVPIRIVLLKARQWGGSTLAQIYIAWLQCRVYKGLNSVIIADVEDQARNIRRMYSKLIESYPKELGEIKWGNYEGSSKIKYWAERETVISVGSAQKPDSSRSFDVRALHASEIGLWKATEGKTPEDIIQGIEGTLPLVPESISVLESTAKGVGNYFHNAWLKAEKGDSNYKPVFVPWFVIENYSMPFEDEAEKVRFVKRILRCVWLLVLGSVGAILHCYNL